MSQQSVAKQIAPPVALPTEGEALLSMATMASALGRGESSTWVLASTDPAFPKLIRMGPRCTRIRLSEARAYIASLGATSAAAA